MSEDTNHDGAPTPTGEDRRLHCLALAAQHRQEGDIVGRAREYLSFVTGEDGATAGPQNPQNPQVTEKDLTEALRADYAGEEAADKLGGVRGWGDQLAVDLSPDQGGHVDFTRADGVATVRIDRWVSGADSKALETLLRRFFADLQSRQMAEAFATQDEVARKVMYAKRMGAGPLVGR